MGNNGMECETTMNPPIGPSRNGGGKVLGPMIRRHHFLIRNQRSRSRSRLSQSIILGSKKTWLKKSFGRVSKLAMRSKYLRGEEFLLPFFVRRS